MTGTTETIDDGDDFEDGQSPAAPDDGRRFKWVDFCDVKADGVMDNWCLTSSNGCASDEYRQRLWWYATSDKAKTLNRTGSTRCRGIDDEESDEEEPEDAVTVTETEFRSLPIPASEIIFQTPVEEHDDYGIALVGHWANQWAEGSEHEISTTILDTPVRVKATPTQYRWDYGDGRTLTVSEPGGPRPHTADPYEYRTVSGVRYDETGNYEITLETVYSGAFSIDGGPWQPISGHAVVPSEPKVNSIWKRETRLVSEDCTENPEGWACDSQYLVTPPWEE